MYKSRILEIQNYLNYFRKIPNLRIQRIVFNNKTHTRLLKTRSEGSGVVDIRL